MSCYGLQTSMPTKAPAVGSGRKNDARKFPAAIECRDLEEESQVRGSESRDSGANGDAEPDGKVPTSGTRHRGCLTAGGRP